jgi:hypothetical protein
VLRAARMLPVVGFKRAVSRRFSGVPGARRAAAGYCGQVAAVPGELAAARRHARSVCRRGLCFPSTPMHYLRAGSFLLPASQAVDRIDSMMSLFVVVVNVQTGNLHSRGLLLTMVNMMVKSQAHLMRIVGENRRLLRLLLASRRLLLPSTSTFAAACFFPSCSPGALPLLLFASSRRAVRLTHLACLGAFAFCVSQTS